MLISERVTREPAARLTPPRQPHLLGLRVDHQPMVPVALQLAPSILAQGAAGANELAADGAELTGEARGVLLFTELGVFVLADFSGARADGAGRTPAGAAEEPTDHCLSSILTNTVLLSRARSQ